MFLLSTHIPIYCHHRDHSLWRFFQIDKELVEPTTRSKMESQLNLIARGEADFEKVLGDVLKLFKKKYQFFTKNIEDMDSLFEVSFTPLADSGKALSR